MHALPDPARLQALGRVERIPHDQGTERGRRGSWVSRVPVSQPLLFCSWETGNSLARARMRVD